MRGRIRVKHYSGRMKTQYVQCASRFVLYRGVRHGRAEAEVFGMDRAVGRAM